MRKEYLEMAKELQIFRSQVHWIQINLGCFGLALITSKLKRNMPNLAPKLFAQYLKLTKNESP